MSQILVALDFSDVSDRVVAEAGKLGKAFGDKLWLIHVAAPDPDFVGYEAGPQHVRDNRAHELREEHRRLQAWAEGLRAQGLEATALLVQGPTVSTLLETIKKHDIEYVVMGTHGHGKLYKLLMGNVSEGVIREAHVPVLLVPTQK
ncbi:universal stress protein [Acanthopleuribacter pedis]|uniref:Universal stress protein n=1 Tax=Acanthopleuribacter pedis TaxID=442870 RepID=A0A8J7QCB4_9BACT|nr:universal stress protein [Acanthopleuribacter pedis]MBO1321837.1 universal stress protein [Acanthopleuribacter pedis]